MKPGPGVADRPAPGASGLAGSGERPSRNAVCLCTDRNMLIPALFVADSVRSRLPASAHRYDVIVFCEASEVTEGHRRWMQDRGIVLRDDMDMARLSALKRFSGRLTAATLMKLLLAEHLAGSYDRILYLDSDVSIHGDIGRIFSLDTGGYEIAAVPAGRLLLQLTEKQRDETFAHFRALGMTEPFRFFNSGVLYIDVNKWNRARLGDRALAYIRDNPDLCFLPDEHALNAVLDGSLAELTLVWNARPPSGEGRAALPFIEPVVLHYAGHDKPWRRYGYRKRLFPDRAAYRHYEAFLKETPWPGWLDEQWSARDLWGSVAWEFKRVSRRLRGKLDEPTRARRAAQLDAGRRFWTEGDFADVRQGLVEQRDGRLQLTDR
ncbi:glycosyltransferase family 8 protein [Mesorhizobium sp. ZMM04-5]|uniref:Glycosyltransferase family 8 protein n=1 Tax=Mesorhizobium marinum TaxID=3228790 RepID=A0ABV3R7D9_9HYPH